MSGRFLAVGLACAMSTCGNPLTKPLCLVSTAEGAVQGVKSGAICAYQGIPFAAPPVGARRWKPPQPAAAWSPAVLQATGEPAVCLQVSPEGSGVTRGAEDCLTLNVWTPDPPPSSPAPVIFWIHAGAFTSGSANLTNSDVRGLAAHTGAVIVAANYRLGPLGFLAHPALTAEDYDYPSSGNYGLLDQRAALEWIHDRIEAFGGNPRDVTIAGQSAGAHSVSLHVVSPRSAGHFSRAIMQNGWASTRWRTIADAEVLGVDLATALGCVDQSEALRCLRSRTPEQILLALPTGLEQFAETARAPWIPVVDGVEVPDQPRMIYEAGAFNPVPIFVGSVASEGWTLVDRSFPSELTASVYEAEVEAEFGTAAAPAIRARYPLAKFRSPKHALARIAGDVEQVCEAQRIAQLIERTGTPVAAFSVDRTVGTHDQEQHDGDALLFEFIGSAWTRLAAGDYQSFRTAPAKPGDSPCDFWNQLFLSSVAGSVPASMP